MKTSGLAVLALAAMVSATACGKDDAVVVDTTATMGGTATGTVDNALKVSDLSLGRTVGADNRISDGTDEFKPNDAIIAVVETEGVASGHALVARWTFQDGQVVEEQTQTVNSTGGKAYTQFRVTKPSGWPLGKYKLTIWMNNAEVDSEEFEVKN